MACVQHIETALAKLERCIGELARATVSADATRAAFVDKYGTFSIST